MSTQRRDYQGAKRSRGDTTASIRNAERRAFGCSWQAATLRGTATRRRPRLASRFPACARLLLCKQALADWQRIRNHVLPRKRPIQDQLSRRPADLPDPPGPHLHLAAAGGRLHRRPGAGQRLPAARHPHSLPDPVAGRRGPEHPGGLLRPDLAGHRRLHGGGRLRGLELRRALSRHAADRADPAGRLLRHHRGRDLRHSQPAHTRPVRRWPRWRRSSSWTGPSCASRSSPTTRPRATSRCRS